MGENKKIDKKKEASRIGHSQQKGNKMQLEYLKQKREARLLILERLVHARNELIALKMPHTDLDSSIKHMRNKVKASNKKILKIMVDKKKESL